MFGQWLKLMITLITFVWTSSRLLFLLLPQLVLWEVPDLFWSEDRDSLLALTLGTLDTFRLSKILGYTFRGVGLRLKISTQLLLCSTEFNSKCEKRNRHDSETDF